MKVYIVMCEWCIEGEEQYELISVSSTFDKAKENMEKCFELDRANVIKDNDDWEFEYYNEGIYASLFGEDWISYNIYEKDMD